MPLASNYKASSQSVSRQRNRIGIGQNMRHNHTVIEKEEYYRSGTNETNAAEKKEVSKGNKEDLWILKPQHSLSGTCIDKVIHLVHRSVQFSKENAEESTHWIPESSRSVLLQLESDIEDVFTKQITLSYNKTSYDVTFSSI
jgi:hypothetical protein